MEVCELDSQGLASQRYHAYCKYWDRKQRLVNSKQAKHNIRRYIDERLPEEYEKCLVRLTAITKEAWNTAANAEDKREKIQALSLAIECYSMKLELLTNATVVDDAIRFLSQKSKEKVESTNSNDDTSKVATIPIASPITK
jgi:hypothetical protein